MPESLQLNSSAKGYIPRSPKDSSPRRKMGYKPPTPPRSFKKKLSPKIHHSSSPPPPYIPSTTPTLSSSSASNYSSHSQYQQPATKTSAFISDTATYSIPSVTYASSAAYPAPDAEPYSALYNPEDEQSNSYSTPSPESYHIPGANPPPPSAFMNPPPPSDYPLMARNPSPTDNYQQSGNEYEPARNFSPTTGFNERGGDYPIPIPPGIPPPDYSLPPPSTSEYKPFYSSNNLTMPPLLGEDCPPSSLATSSLDRFLQGSNENSQNGPSAGAGFSSFMGNLNLPFEFQVSLLKMLLLI